MDINIIVQFYENNKMFEGKKIKFFKDPKETNRRKYKLVMPSDEEIVFGIKKNLSTHIMTDKAFYYEYLYSNAIELVNRFDLRRVSIKDIYKTYMKLHLTKNTQ